MKFNSQICTTRSQSERLLALGVKKETADMCINPSRELVYPFSYSEALTLYDNYGFGKIMEADLLLPSWSLHRLMEVYGSNYNYLCFQNAYNELIHAISISIEDGTFNKDYLEEKK